MKLILGIPKSALRALPFRSIAIQFGQAFGMEDIPERPDNECFAPSLPSRASNKTDFGNPMIGS